MKRGTPYSIKRPPPQSLRECFSVEPRWDRGFPKCEAIVASSSVYNGSPQRWMRCSFDATANGYCGNHQYLAKEAIVGEFYIIVPEDGPPLQYVYVDIEEAKDQAEAVSRRTGANVYICSPMLKAATHRVEWEPIVEEVASPKRRRSA